MGSEKIHISMAIERDSQLGIKFKDLRDHVKEETSNRRSGNANTARYAFRRAWDDLQRSKRFVDVEKKRDKKYIYGEDR